jgi:hypothetical protein
VGDSRVLIYAARASFLPLSTRTLIRHVIASVPSLLKSNGPQLQHPVQPRRYTRRKKERSDVRSWLNCFIPFPNQRLR